MYVYWRLQGGIPVHSTRRALLPQPAVHRGTWSKKVPLSPARNRSTYPLRIVFAVLENALEIERSPQQQARLVTTFSLPRDIIPIQPALASALLQDADDTLRTFTEFPVARCRSLEKSTNSEVEATAHRYVGSHSCFSRQGLLCCILALVVSLLAAQMDLTGSWSCCLG